MYFGLKVLVEQLVVTGENDPLDEDHLRQAEALLAHIVNADYRHAVINNFGKTGGVARTARSRGGAKKGRPSDKITNPLSPFMVPN